MIQHLRKHHKNMKVEYLMHESRTNGLTEYMMNRIDELQPELVILPDSGSNDRLQTKNLYEKGIDTLILDHHIMESTEDNAYATVVNPQLCLDAYPNENLAAGGITYKFIQALDEKYGTNDADNYLDLVAISTISDAMDITEPESRYYVYKGLANIKNNFIKHLLYKNAGWAKEIYPRLVSFHASNFINAVIRVGTVEEKETVFRAMLNEEESNTRISKYRGVEREVTENLSEQAYRLCSNARGRQNRRKAKLYQEAVEQIELHDLNKNQFIIVNLHDLPSGFSGLVAMQIATSYRKPSIVVSRGENGVFTGSLRGSSSSPVEDIKSFLLETNLFEFVRGHEAAAGLSITEENLKLLDKAINKKLQFESSQKPIEVDFEIHSNSLTEELIEEVYSLEKHFGKGCEEILFAITDIEVDSKDISMGNTMKFNKGNIEFMSFSVDDRFIKLKDEEKVARLTVIGTLGKNIFLGKTTLQVKVEAFDIKETYVDDNPLGSFEF